MIFVGLEVSLRRSTWHRPGLFGQHARQPKDQPIIRVEAGDSVALLSVLRQLQAQAEQHCHGPVKIVMVREAGLDGFWLHSLLEAEGIESWVIDAASIA